MPGMSPPLKSKDDPDKSVIAVLKKHHQEGLMGDVQGWLNAGLTGSPGTLKKEYIMAMSSEELNDWDVDLKDPTTWGEVEDLPSDQFFLDLYKACRADEKRNAKRSSYEF